MGPFPSLHGVVTHSLRLGPDANDIGLHSWFLGKSPYVRERLSAYDGSALHRSCLAVAATSRRTLLTPESQMEPGVAVPFQVPLVVGWQRG
jgi:hypothetical protein